MNYNAEIIKYKLYYLFVINSACTNYITFENIDEEQNDKHSTILVGGT